MRIYLDTCCLNRPFDNQAMPKIHLEAEAIKTILTLCEDGQWQLMSSEVLILEIEKTPDLTRQHYLSLLLDSASSVILLDDRMVTHAKAFEEAGVKPFDALHLACAMLCADILLTVDDKFLKKANTLNIPNLRIAHPLKWLEETLYDFYS